jgi:hypothetical protein
MAQTVVLAAVIFAFYLIVRVVATAAAGLAHARYRAFRQLALRFGGRYESRGLTEPPTVSFLHQTAPVRVGVAPTYGVHHAAPPTRVIVRFPTAIPLRLELFSTARGGPNQPPKGTRVVQTGDPEFDRNYLTRANDADITREFLGPSVRWAIENLRRLAPPGGVLISVNPERLLVQVNRNFAQQADLLCFVVEQTLGIFDQLVVSVRLQLTQGIAILAAGPASLTEDGPPLCKVCGESITASHVVCKTCYTPHHRDCWQFVGGCSIFGCNGKDCVKV